MDMVSLHSEVDYDALQPDNWGIPSIDAASISKRARCLNQRSLVEGEESMQTAGTVKLDMIVMPGLAFDRKHRRLGHGKGYYDLFLCRYHAQRQIQDRNVASGEDVAASGERMPYLVGLALNEQVLPEGESIPTGPLDCSLDAVIVGDEST